MGGSISRVLYTADAYCKDGKRFTVIADDKLTAFLKLESVIRASGELPRKAGEIFPKRIVSAVWNFRLGIPCYEARIKSLGHAALANK
jgi:hypothetical protein